jgi:hypothetical protein
MVFKSNGNGGMKISLANLLAIMTLTFALLGGGYAAVTSINDKLAVVSNNVVAIQTQLDGFCKQQDVEHNKIDVLQERLTKSVNDIKMEIIRIHPGARIR